MTTTARQRIGAVVRLEWRTQRREPLTVLYALVLGLLAAAFAAQGPVELVRGRGIVPRDAAWSLMLAATALTAFGQVITTMVAATVVLRDRQDRVAELLGVTPLTTREYLVGKLLAALLVLGVVYAAIPVGMVAGAVGAGGGVTHAVSASVQPFVVLVLPTMLAVGALQFAAGVLSGRLWVLLGLGLVLIWVWSATVDAATRVDAAPWRVLLDPFGSAPLLEATSGWSDAERASRAMPVTWVVVTGRALWLLVGLGAAAVAIVAGRPLREGVRRSRGVGDAGASRVMPDVGGRVRAALPARAAGGVGAWRGGAATARHTASWMLRDAGWRVLTLLGALNVGVHAVLDARGAHDAAAAALVAHAVLAEHARLFLILLATIYAGELVWREREDRSAPLFDVLPVRDVVVVAGRVGGVMLAQVVVWLVLVAAALAGVLAGAGVLRDAAGVLAWSAGQVLVPFVRWLLLSLAVHAVVQQKVVGHLLCIAGWVAGVLLLGAARPGVVQVPGWVLGASGMVALVIVRTSWVRGAGRMRA